MAVEQNQSVESTTDVLIIGAGPAGLMACHALAKLGIRVRIVDKRPEKLIAGQADGIQPRTMEIFQSYGLLERLLKEGNQIHTAAFYNPNAHGTIELTDRVPDVTAPTARYPFEVTLHQGAIEAIFMDSMAASGVEVERHVAPVSISLDEAVARVYDKECYPVKASLRNLFNGNLEVVNAKILIGADGAHSWVRKSLGIAMEGEQTDYVWGVIDIAEPESDFPDIRNKAVVHSNHGTCMVIPREGDKVRVYIQLDDGAVLQSIAANKNKSNGRIDMTKLAVGPEDLLCVAQKILHPYTLRAGGGKFEWWTVYTIGQRVASQFSVHNRIFIVGDACHTHSPKAGQGMNASMGDSHNLVWKISAVLNGWVDPDVLDTYELERRKYAQDLISFDRKFAKLFSGKPRTEQYQDGVSHEEFLQIFQTFGGFTSGIGMRYLGSTITDADHTNSTRGIKVGERFPPRPVVRAADSRPMDIQDLLHSDGRFKVLVFLEGEKEATIALEALSIELEHVTRMSPANNLFAVTEVLTFIAGTGDSPRDVLNWTSWPLMLRSHWSKIFVEKPDGAEYSPEVIVVRPDGYIGKIIPSHSLESQLSNYFSGFLRKKTQKSTCYIGPGLDQS
ncbi:FAD binding domain-containing protein [Coprinopsis cinerea okayama7|uniref:FAD binding domain-containing protein n=1 Tax=Coprinopsis cinerea (strain Okayama-7 / 130 / ATCC MYA-4618 / FGSC 9003) TaxID=240176 RepID=D6RNN7_COPC7|nr:FAD binding domain-containing protein [Coprinopsis cinerea okayama7\|eukprot:XP_002910830.1 FAD binding domain-containing protein [Coprinopsis cinerea okayama7\